MGFLAGVLSIANPWWLLGIPLSATGLIFLYRKRSHGMRVLVPSTFIWKQLAMDARAPKKRVIPWRFLFDWLLCSLLCIAASGISLVNEHSHGILVLDNSFSTFARVPGGGSQQTALSLVKNAAERILRKNNHLVWSTYVTSPTLTLLGEASERATTAIAHINDVESHYAEDNFERAIASLRVESSDAKIFGITDRPLKASSLLGNPAMELITVRDNTLNWSNIAITGVNLVKGPKENTRAAQIQLTSYATEDVSVSVVLRTLNRIEQHSASQTLKIAAKESTAVQLAVDAITSNSFEVSVSTTHPRDLQSDLIKEDNSAWIAYSAHEQEIGVVSSLSLAELGLDRVGEYSFKKLTLEELASESTEGLLGIILHRNVPEVLPAHNLLIVYPSSDTNLFDAGKEASSLFATNWDQQSPLLRYVSLADLNFPQSRILNPPSWSQTVVGATGGSLLFEGEREDTRLLVTGFELFPFQGMSTPRLSILTLNFLRWLETGGQTGNSFTLGTINSLKDITALTPVSQQPASATGSIVYPGIYQLTTKNNDERMVAVNYLGTSESDLLTPEPVDFKDAASLSPSKESVSNSLVYLLATVILALLLLELLIVNLRLASRRRKLR